MPIISTIVHITWLLFFIYVVYNFIKHKGNLYTKVGKDAELIKDKSLNLIGASKRALRKRRLKKLTGKKVGPDFSFLKNIKYVIYTPTISITLFFILVHGISWEGVIFSYAIAGFASNIIYAQWPGILSKKGLPKFVKFLQSIDFLLNLLFIVLVLIMLIFVILSPFLQLF